MMKNVLHPITRRSFLAGAGAVSAIAVMHPFSARAQANQAHLRIMETTDVHVAVLPYDYYADKPNDTMGLARTASIIDGFRKEATNTMLIDNGDYLQGNPMGDWIAYERGMKEGDMHPVIEAMNLLGYDCGTLGNHEFNYGLSFMDKVNAGANYPIVCANLVKGTQLAANPRDDTLYIACHSGAVGKAPHVWNYVHHDLGDKAYETAVRVIRADYCNDGTSFTQEGQQLLTDDDKAYNSAYNPAEDTELLASWDKGIVCVNPKGLRLAKIEDVEEVCEVKYCDGSDTWWGAGLDLMTQAL